MSRPERQLNPERSSLERFGYEVRKWRKARRLSLERAGALVHVSGALVQRIEIGERRPTREFAVRCDDAFRAGGEIIAAWEVLAESEAQRTLSEYDSGIRQADGVSDHSGRPDVKGADIAGGPTLLRVLVKERHWQQFDRFRIQFERAAQEVSDRDHDPEIAKTRVSARQYERWYSGGMKTGPHPDACRVLEYMFGYPISRLLAPAAGFGQGAAMPVTQSGEEPALMQPSLVGQASGKPNLVLRNIRETERGESREQFAAAMAATAREMGYDVTPDGKYVERLESGRIEYPGQVYRNILSALCGRPVAELGFFLPVTSVASGEGNSRLREIMFAKGIETRELARRVGVDPKSAERWQTRGVIPHPRHRFLVSKILGCQQSDLWPDQTPEVEHRVASQNSFTDTLDEKEQEGIEMERRNLLQSLGVLGVASAPAIGAIDHIRRSLGSAFDLSDCDHLDDWESTVAEYGYSYFTTSPSELITDLAADIVSIRSIVAEIPRESLAYRGWCRISASISCLMAKCFSNLGSARESRQWWNMAEHLSDSSGDIELSLWVRGERIVHGLYERRPTRVLLRQVDSAADSAKGHTGCAGFAHISTARAQALVLAGDYDSAEEELRRASDVFASLPSEVSQDTSSVMKWGRDRLHYTETWVYGLFEVNRDAVTV